MPSDKEYLDYVLDLLRDTNGVSYRKMMGEYVLYFNKTIFGGVYDNRLLVKMTPSCQEYRFKTCLPYQGAKPMYIIDIEDKQELKELVQQVCADLNK